MVFNIFTFPLIGSSIMLLFIAVWAWQRRSKKGAKSFALLSLSCAIYSLGYAFEVSSVSLQHVLFWLKIEYLGIATLPAFFLLFALSYTGRSQRITLPVLVALFIIPVVTIILFYTNHQLIYQAVWMNVDGPFPVVSFLKGPWYWVQIFYLGFAVISSNVLFVLMWLHAAPFYRKQIFIVILGSMVPWGAHLVYQSMHHSWQLDYAPFALTISSLLFFWGLFRYRLLDLTPVVRATLFEQTSDGVLVLDNQQSIVDINKSAMDYLQLTTSAIGEPLNEVLKAWPDLASQLKNRNGKYQVEMQLNSQETAYWFGLDLLPLQGKYGETTGQIILLRDITERKQAEENLNTLSDEYEKVFNGTQDAMFLVDVADENKFRYIRNNRSHKKRTGLTTGEMRGKTPQELLGEEFGNRIAANYSRCVQAMKPISYEETLTLPAGELTWLTTLTPVSFNNQVEYIVGSSQDITQRKKAEESMRVSEERYRLLVENANDAIVVAQDGVHKFVNPMAVVVFGQSEDVLTSTPFIEFIHPEDSSKVIDHYKKRIGGDLLRESYTFRIIAGDGSLKWVELRAVRIEWEGRPASLNFINDITERKKKEEQLKFISLHDQLTSLYNRAFFEEEMRRLSGSREFPITIISADIDGLKLINDTMGHVKGDELLNACAQVLCRSLRSSDILARIGGDEFAVIMSRTDKTTAEEVTKRIRSNVSLHNKEHRDMPLSISLGTATAENSNFPLEEIYKKADDLMFSNKLSSRNINFSNIVDTLLASLAERDSALGHTAGLSELCLKMGNKMGLSSRQLTALELLARVHDLGNVGIPERILHKKGSLTEEEWEIIRQHPEKGYNIAGFSPKLKDVTDLILRHHERWDGKGYPLKLLGEEIPLECRIFTIADAFDSMICGRPFRKSKSMEEAIEELKRCAGTQFDPALVELLESILENNLGTL